MSFVFVIKQKTCDEMLIRDWRSDVCASDLEVGEALVDELELVAQVGLVDLERHDAGVLLAAVAGEREAGEGPGAVDDQPGAHQLVDLRAGGRQRQLDRIGHHVGLDHALYPQTVEDRSEEHTSELQSLMRISYAVFCLKKITENNTHMQKKKSQ